MNKATFESFDEETQKILLKDAEAATEYQKKLNREENDKVLEKWKEAGITFHETTPEEMAQFKALSDPCYDAFEARIVKAGISQEDADALLAAFGIK